MYPFRLIRPNSLEDARNSYSAAESPLYLAGGMTVLPSLKQHLNRPSELIDLSRIETLRKISVSDGTLFVGASQTHAQVAASRQVRDSFPALAALAGKIADRHVRNRGTIGGSLANNDPSADYPAAVLAADARIVTGDRTLPAEAFFTGMFETALDPGEIIVGVSFDLPEAAVYEKFANPISGYAMAGVFACRTRSGFRVAVTGAGASGVFRLTSLEDALNRTATIAALEQIDLDGVELLEDRHAPRTYRENLVGVLAARAVARLLEPAT